MIGVLLKWVKNEDVAKWGCLVALKLVTADTRAPWIATGAEGVLRSIKKNTQASSDASKNSKRALKALGLPA